MEILQTLLALVFWFWLFFSLGVTPDFSSAYILDEWPDSWSQGKEYSFQAFI